MAGANPACRHYREPERDAALRATETFTIFYLALGIAHPVRRLKERFDRRFRHTFLDAGIGHRTSHASHPLIAFHRGDRIRQVLARRRGWPNSCSYSGGPPSQPIRNLNSFSREPASVGGCSLRIP